MIILIPVSYTHLILGDVVDEQSGIRILHDVATQTEAIEMITPYTVSYTHLVERKEEQT